jgi:hypothetical protein
MRSVGLNVGWVMRTTNKYLCISDRYIDPLAERSSAELVQYMPMFAGFLRRLPTATYTVTGTL